MIKPERISEAELEKLTKRELIDLILDTNYIMYCTERDNEKMRIKLKNLTAELMR